MKYTLAFDVYGTLINTSGVLDTLVEVIGNAELATKVNEVWRNKQLEYSFRKGLMGKYGGFSTCTKEALAYCDELFGLQLSEEQIKTLLAKYTVLPAFDDALEGIAQLKDSGHKLYAFSNGEMTALEKLLSHSNILPHLDGIVSMDGVQTFKPNPKGYAHFNEATGSLAQESYLISSNSFDVIGAAAYGMKTVWVQRSEKMVFDSWGIEPNATIQKLTQLTTALK